jgi:hypothetical protein
MTRRRRQEPTRRDLPARLLAWFFTAVAVLQSGCSAMQPRLLSAQDRENLGTVAVTSARYAPQTRIKGPGQTGGAAGIAIGGLGAAAATVASCLNPVAILTCPTMVLTMGALGATAGGVIGHQINAHVTGAKIEATGPADLDDPRTQTVLRDRVVEHARSKTPLDYVAVNDPAPATPADKPDYRTLAASGIDTVVEVALLDVTTEGRPGGGLWLTMNSRIRVVRAANGAVIGDEIFRYRSDAHPYEKWKDPKENLLRAALEHGYQTIAERVAGELAAQRR